MRIILFTGKGGVGKTSVAAATAVRCAKIGYKTVVISTDSAHSLADSFDMEVGNEPTFVSQNLYAEEIDVNYEIKKNWGAIQGFLQQFLRYQGFKNVIAEELAVFPGMEEVFSLLELKSLYVTGLYDVIIIDCAPTGDTLRLLSVPDIARWYMEKLFNIERNVMKAIRPLAKQFVEMPLPTDAVYESAEGLYKNIRGMKEVLADKDTSSIRMVINPEKMVINESQRAHTFLNLFGFSTDGIIVNRILPEEIEDPYYVKWKEIQKAHLKKIEESFYSLPIFTSRLWGQEVVGLKSLSMMAKDIYGEKDPTQIFFKEKPMEITEENGNYYLLIKLPFANQKLLDIWTRGEELTVKFKNFKRNILLPRALASLKVKEAQFKDGMLKIKFGGDTNE